MTWSYDPSEATDLDRVRGKIGDINTLDQQLPNETLNAIIAIKADVIDAAIECLNRLIAKYARDIDRSAVGITSSRSQRMNHYADLRDRLERDRLLVTEPFVGGISKSEADVIDANTDFPQPKFKMGGDDHP